MTGTLTPGPSGVPDEHRIVKSPDVNWGAWLEQVTREYNTEPALGLWHGLQKEAIQNSHGARDRQSRKPWACRIRLVRTGSSPLLTITDEGTYGLTGVAIWDVAGKPDALPSTERLARFESMFDSGGGEGPGLFGRGKLVFNACSEQRLVFYDSLTKDGKYRFGKRQFRGRACEQFARVYEGQEAEACLQKEFDGALQRLATPGTRITVVNPLAEVLNAVASGELLMAIGDTWWEILQKEKAEITVAGLDGHEVRATVPENFGGLPKTSRNKWRVHAVDNVPLEIQGSKYKVKHLHILLPPQGHKMREEQLGIFLHRRGMQVGRLQIAGMPEEVSDRLFGYVQLDEEFEEVLAPSENTTHYGFSHTKRPEFRSLRKWVQDSFSAFMDSIGYGAKTDRTALQRQSAEEAQAALNGILKELGVPSLGGGQDTRREILVAIEKLNFPGDSNCLSLGDSLEGFVFRVRNRTDLPRIVFVEVSTHADATGTIETILPKVQMKVPGQDSMATVPLQIQFKAGIYPSPAKVSCTAAVYSAEGKQLARRSFQAYLGMRAPEPEQDLAEVELVDVEFPREDSHRVNFGQSILGLAYLIHNRTPHSMLARIKVRMISAKEGVELDDVLDQTETIGPYGSVDCRVAEIKITKEKYEEVGRGKIKLRCSVAALEATPDWEKGRRLGELTTMVYLEMDPAAGLFEEFALWNGGPNAPRSEAKPTAGTRSWRLDLNSGHPAFGRAESDGGDAMGDYMFEESARQTAFVLLRRDQSEVIVKVLGLDPKTQVDEMDPEDVLQKIVYPFSDRIVAKYYG